MNIRVKKSGSYLPVILMVVVLFMGLIVAIVSIALSHLKLAKNHEKDVSAVEVAEAGINYYLWHLSHDNEDYCDGNTCEGEAPFGPYTHEYTDQSGNVVGEYDLYITPPATIGGVVTVKAIGRVVGRDLDRTIIASLGMPSFTKYTLMVHNQQLWLGSSERVVGNVHINNSGVYNEGEITGDASSTEETYDGWFGSQPGVAGPGIYGGSKLYPVPAVDFDQVNIDIAQIRDEVMTGGGHYIAESNRRGWRLVLGANSFDVYEVRNFHQNGYYVTHETYDGNYPYPDTGVIFVEDDMWIEGQIDNKKLSFFAADPDESSQSKQKRIVVTGNLSYTNYDGSDKVGLVTQTDILLAQNCPGDMELDAAMIARYGEIKIDDYGEVKNSIRVYGSMAHNTGIMWTYATGGGSITSGYTNTELIIDESNVLNPPPRFPTTGSYAVLNWREE